MKAAGIVFLILLCLCSFVHYPLAIISPIGVKDEIGMVFSFEFPHIFLASILSLVYLSFNLHKLNHKSIFLRLSGLATLLILLSSLIYNVPLYRMVEVLSFFTVPLAVSVALKNSNGIKAILISISILFIMNLVYCYGFGNNVGIAGNKNWLAATLICGFPFFVLLLKKLPLKFFYPLVAITGLLMLNMLISTSARALIPAIGLAVFYFCIQRKSKKFNSMVFGGLALAVIILAFMKSDKVKRVVNQDIRGPLLADSFSLIASTPFLGTGPGNFQKDFPPHASETLKKRIYYSSISEHPHNELVNFMANCGIPAALLWLVFVCRLLKERDDFEGMAFQFGLICAFIMGLADKPLSESPSAIIFLLLCGLLIPESEHADEEVQLKVLKPAGAVLACGVVIFGALRIQGDVQSRYHFWKGESMRMAMNSQNQKVIVPQMFEHFKKSMEYDPHFINAAYNAAAVSLHFYNSLSQDQKLLDHMMNLEPDYSDINKWIGLYYLKQARLLGEGSEKDETEAVAEQYYLRNFVLSPWNINRCRELIRFYVETKNFAKVEEWILKAGEVARERLKARYTHTDRIDLEGDLQKVLESVRSSGELPFNIFDGMKANEGGDYYRFDLFSKSKNLKTFTRKRVNPLDSDFWKRRLSLLDEMRKRGINSSRDVLNLMLSFEQVKAEVSWPLDVLKEQKGSVKSVASLACTMNGLLGNTSTLMVNKAGLTLCVLFDKEQSLIWNCQKGELFEVSLAAFHSDGELRKTITGSETDDFEYELFCYPEAFCLRNQLFSNILSLHPEVPEFCLSPTLERVRLSKKNGARKIRYASDHVRLLDAAAEK